MSSIFERGGWFYVVIFIQEKKDGSYRMIRNFKQLSKHIEYEDFKMDSIKVDPFEVFWIL